MLNLKLTTKIISIFLVLSISYSYADCKASINNFSGDSWTISFLSEDGNVYFNINPALCPSSDIHHGIPKNGPCIIEPGQFEISYTDNKWDAQTKGHGMITNSQGISYKFSYNNETSLNNTCPTISLSPDQTIPANIKLNEPTTGSITLENN